MLALQPCKRFVKDNVLVVDGALAVVPTCDHTFRAVEEPPLLQQRPDRIDADTRLVVVAGRPFAGDRNDCAAWEESGAKTAVGKTMTIADGGYPGAGLVMPTTGGIPSDRGRAAA